MRVTSIMKDYIREEVTKRIAPRYEGKAEYKEQIDTKLQNFFEELCDELNTLMNQRVDKFLKDNGENYEDARTSWNTTVSYGKNIIPKQTPEYNWKNTMNKEISNKVKEIIVTLELGGSKKDLDELLSKI